MSTYTLRIALTSLTLALLTGLLIWRGPQIDDVSLIGQAPDGSAVSTNAAIHLNFARPVDQRSVEQHLLIQPQVIGTFTWQDTTLTFRPIQPLAPNTAYRVILRAGLRDAQGRMNRQEISWSFQTRASTLLVIEALPGPTSTLRLVQPDGVDLGVAATLAEQVLAASLAPDQQQAVVSVSRGPQRKALLIVNLSDGGAQTLVDDPEASVDTAAWSPLDDFILYVRRPLAGATLEPAQVWLAHPDGSSLGPLLSGAVPGDMPVWAPDGQQVAFVGGAGADLTIYSFFSESRRSLAPSAGEAPAWSPDSSAVIYAATAGAERAGPRVLRRANLGDNQLTDLSAGHSDSHSPAWSPDGQQIAFVRQDASGSSIWVMAPDGSAARQLSAGGQDHTPRWSPDGRQLVFLRSERDGTSSAWVVDPADGAPHLVRTGVVQALWIS